MYLEKRDDCNETEEQQKLNDAEERKERRDPGDAEYRTVLKYPVRQEQSGPCQRAE